MVVGKFRIAIVPAVCKSWISCALALSGPNLQQAVDVIHGLFYTKRMDDKQNWTRCGCYSSTFYPALVRKPQFFAVSLSTVVVADPHHVVQSSSVVFARHKPAPNNGVCGPSQELQYICRPMIVLTKVAG